MFRTLETARGPITVNYRHRNLVVESVLRRHGVITVDLLRHVFRRYKGGGNAGAAKQVERRTVLNWVAARSWLQVIDRSYIVKKQGGYNGVAGNAKVNHNSIATYLAMNFRLFEDLQEVETGDIDLKRSVKPDLIFYMREAGSLEAEISTGIEVELTQKSSNRYSGIFKRHAVRMDSGDYSNLFYMCGTTQILEAVERHRDILGAHAENLSTTLIGFHAEAFFGPTPALDEVIRNV